MQFVSEYEKAHPEIYYTEQDDYFAMEPYDHYEELRDRLIECVPDFRRRLKLNPRTNCLVFSADVNSMFDIAWYTLARFLSEDLASEDKGKKETPKEL